MMRQLATGLWVIDRPFSLFGLQLGGRMTLIRLADGSLILHSPVALDEPTAAAIDALGPVRWIVAPNKMHHTFLAQAAARYPEALLLGAPGLATRRRDLHFAGELGEALPPVWRSELTAATLDGAPSLNEVVLLHRPSRTLIACDLVFNFEHAEGLLTRLYLRTNRALGRMAQTQIHRKAIKDRAAARASLDHILGWDFDRLVVAHGAVAERNAKEALRAATAWL